MGVLCRAAGGRKALKRRTARAGREAWGHSVTELLAALRPAEPAIGDVMLDRGRVLDQLYIATRYPNGLPSGAPVDYFTRAEAERGIGDAEAIVVVSTLWALRLSSGSLRVADHR